MVPSTQEKQASCPPSTVYRRTLETTSTVTVSSPELCLDTLQKQTSLANTINMSSQRTFVPSVPAEVRKAIRSQLSSITTSYTARCEGYIMNRNDADNYFSIIESPHEGALPAIPVQSGNKLLHQPPSGQAALATANRSSNDITPAERVDQETLVAICLQIGNTNSK